MKKTTPPLTSFTLDDIKEEVRRRIITTRQDLAILTGLAEQFKINVDAPRAKRKYRKYRPRRHNGHHPVTFKSALATAMKRGVPMTKAQIKEGVLTAGWNGKIDSHMNGPFHAIPNVKNVGNGRFAMTS